MESECGTLSMVNRWRAEPLGVIRGNPPICEVRAGGARGDRGV